MKARSSVFAAALSFCLLTAGCTTQKGVQSARARDEGIRKALSARIATLQAQEKKVKEAEELLRLRAEIDRLEETLREKRYANSLAYANHKTMAQAMDNHTNLYSLKGKYRVMVIPVQFTDHKLARPEFFAPGVDGKTPAQDYLFGDSANTLTEYYKHASLGQLKVEGVTTPVVTVPGTLKDYGEAVVGNSDVATRKLVVDALVDLKGKVTDESWWDSFDQWDLGDYDSDKHFNEPDGFVDAVILIYAGKSQASCQRDFDPEGKRPASADVPPGPKQASTIECFNRIWPHRWSVSIPADDPLYTAEGPLVEGERRPSMNGLRITDRLYALDYNMQSEYSDRSTFMHEFGHSLTLPDVYAMQGENSTGSWELMSSNGRLQAQELSSYSRLSLGWLSPKIVKQGQKDSAYLGSYSFVSEKQREDFGNYSGPDTLKEEVNGVDHVHSVLSTTPEFEEPVYRSIVALPDQALEKIKVVEPKPTDGRYSAYSGKFDGQARGLRLKIAVPAEGDATLRFDTFYQIETETNFDSREEQIKIVTDYDLGSVLVNGAGKEDLRLISGDTNYDTLADLNPACEAQRVLALRTKKNSEAGLTDAEKKEFADKKAVCQAPVWVEKSYDLSALRGQDAEIEIRLVTDAGYTELGIVVDNIRLGSKAVDFEKADNRPLGDWTLLEDGTRDEYHSQFYLFEYRTPGETYVREGKEVSFNMDNNISVGSQGMFVDEGANPVDKFRLVEFSYQPGVLVWYFNSKYDRRSNSASAQNGKGYLLVLNSKVQEIPLPGIMSKPELFKESGEYAVTSDAYKNLRLAQERQFICFSHTAYESYLQGQAPDYCGADDAFKDAMLGLKLGGQPLMYRRQWFNDLLPAEQYAYYGVGKPFSTDPGLRTGLSTFRPSDSGEVAPFKVYKPVNGKLVLDEALTASTARFKPVSEFKDSENALPASQRFWGDTVVVEKKGFGFKVAAPSKRILDSYKASASPDDNASSFRRPRAKVYFNWGQ